MAFNPGGNNNDIKIFFDGNSATEPASETCVDAGDSGGICWTFESIVDLNVDDTDTDGDGLTDLEELSGVDIDSGDVLPSHHPNVPPSSMDEAKVFACHHDTFARRGYFRQVTVGPAFMAGVAGVALGGG